MIWTCAATGKTSLTFEEALESERNAQVNQSSDGYFAFCELSKLLFPVHFELF